MRPILLGYLSLVLPLVVLSLPSSLALAAPSDTAPAATAAETKTEQPQIWRKHVRSTDVKSCKEGRKPCGDSCISTTATCIQPAAPQPLPSQISNPETVTTTDIKSCKKDRKPCGDSCISATAKCFLQK